MVPLAHPVSVLAYYIHHLNPIIVRLGPLKPRWYGFAYLMGFLGAYLLIQKLARDGMLRLAPERVPDLVLNCCIFGVLVGGRLGFCLFYQPSLFGFTNQFPYWGVLRVWEGGMSAHGGIVFTILTLIVFTWVENRRIGKQQAALEEKAKAEGKPMAEAPRLRKISLVNIGDAACMVVPVGLFFGRIANFINGELYGHISRVPWAVKFPSELFAPTNGVETIPAEKVLAMKEAVTGWLGQHWQSLSTTQVQDFLSNHDDFRQVIAQQLGGINLGSPTQLTSIKEAIGKYLASDPNALSTWDIGNWWQHGHNALTQFMYGWFDKILPPRHPSQLYEALLEGLLLFIIVWTIGRLWRKDGMAGGAFLTFYPIMRIIGEQFRVGDEALHQNMGLHTTIGAGVIYSALMLVPAVIYWGYWIWRDRRVPWVPVRPAGANKEAVKVE